MLPSLREGLHGSWRRWSRARSPSAEFRTFGGGYKGKGKLGGELGTFALVRATKGGGVIMYAAASLGRELGLHDSIFSGLRHGEYPGTKVTLGPNIPSETATAAAVRRLSSVAVERSPVRPPRLIAAGGLVNLASLYRSKGFEDDATFVDELAQVQTESGIIWVLAASVPRVLELAQKGREGKEAKHNGKSGERTKPASSSSMAPAAVPVHDTGCRVCSKMPDYIYFMWPRSRKG